jgi:hypothetical protein
MRALLVACILAAAPAAAQERFCGPYERVRADLAEKFNEYPVGTGMTGPQHIIQLFVSDEGTFTIVTIGPDRMACGVAAGDGWYGMTPMPGKPA